MTNATLANVVLACLAIATPLIHLSKYSSKDPRKSDSPNESPSKTAEFLIDDLQTAVKTARKNHGNLSLELTYDQLDTIDSMLSHKQAVVKALSDAIEENHAKSTPHR